jgi:putative acetyltransferase
LVTPIIREEEARDHAQVYAINEAAFGHPDEADLVVQLRAEQAVLLSLVAEQDQGIVGHILFTRMTIETADGLIPAVALAPMAVMPDHQNRGIGSQLIRRGLAILGARGERIVIVLGHEHYYPRFGFSSEKASNLESPFPPEAYMALELEAGALDGIRGRVRYPAAFGLEV